MPDTPRVATPAPTTAIESPARIATPEGATRGSRRAAQRRRRLRLRLRWPLLAARRRRRIKPRPRHQHRLLLRRSRSKQQRLLRLRRAPLHDRAEPIDAGPSDAGDAGNDSCSDDRGRSSSGYCDSGGRHCTIVSNRLTPDQVTLETPATTPAPTIEVEAAAAIATPAGATARSCRAD
ncbi:hypothetical protein PR003_g8001 [Phytophthora rubi]|uniref:Uncharacterized protein n=1 Tax=Phytophthora rubi TaxID=129364 RepID=A0A6A4FSB9_9STRA|nr:hypothetical protein PR001_g5689 [Phytophthora rubi]KAE9345330.1 hypothetical protein PR003_g8001 [Phytophthora rubi]